MSQQYFLAKTDPQTYSLDDLEKEKTTVWNGVRNAQALRAIAAMRPGDKVFIYHSMAKDAGVVGLARVASEPRPDAEEEKTPVVDFEFLTRLEPPVSLREIKESHLFDDWSLVKQSRLSTMAAPAAFAQWMKKRFPKSGI